MVRWLAALLLLVGLAPAARADDIGATARGVVRVVTIAVVEGQVVGFGHGSGVAVAPNRIVTNAHVVELAQRYPENVVVGVVPSEGSKSYQGHVIAIDTQRDLALVEFTGAKLPVATLYVGKPAYSTSASDYDAAAAMLKTVRPSVTRFSSSGYINDLAGGSLCAVMGYSGDINIARARALEANPKAPAAIEALVPKGGATLFFDTMAIPKDAPHPNNAHRFIDYILRPEVAAGLTNKVYYANPNAASLKFVRKEVADNPTIFLADADRKRLTPPDAVPQEIRRVQTRIFTSFKAGR